MATIRDRQRKWIGQKLRGGLPLRTIMKGKMKGKKTRGRQRLLAWMMVDGYTKLKEEAQHPEEWCHWVFEHAQGKRTGREDRTAL